MPRVDAKQSARRAKTEMYQRLVLDAAEGEFAERGFEETKIQDVARRAGIALGTLYGVFPSKNDIYAEVQRRRGGELLRFVSGRVAGSGAAAEACLAGIDAYVRFMADHPGYLRMHLREGTAWADGLGLTGEQAATFQQGMDLSEGLFRLGIEQGDFYPGDPRLLVRMMTAAHQVLLKDWVEQGAERAALPDLITSMRQHFVRAFVREAAAARLAGVFAISVDGRSED